MCNCSCDSFGRPYSFSDVDDRRFVMAKKYTCICAMCSNEIQKDRAICFGEDQFAVGLETPFLKGEQPNALADPDYICKRCYVLFKILKNMNR